MVKKATRISRFVTSVEDQPVVVGLDVHKKTYSVALFSKEDGLVESYTCPAGEAALAHQLAELGLNIEHIVYESGPTGFALSRVLTDAGFNVSVKTRGSRVAMDLARPGSQGTLQSTFCEAWDRAEGHCRCCPQARNQALAAGGGHTAYANGG